MAESSQDAPAKLPQIPGYDVLGAISSGGMGTVFRARQRSTAREVAVKVLKQGSDQNLVRRFEREARIAASLRHPNLVTVFEAGQHESLRYLVMELVEGEPLSDLLQRQALTQADLARILGKVAAALDVAHEAGVLHRDLKPPNIIVGSAGQPTLVDFGLAAFSDQLGELTRTGLVVGTPLYLAPETVRDGSSQAAPPGDVYALGVILYEGLTGTNPFLGKDWRETRKKIVEREQPPPPVGVPEELATACRRALAMRPEDRPSARQLSRLLEVAASIAGDAPLPEPRGRPSDSPAERPPMVPPELGTELGREVGAAWADPERRFGRFVLLTPLGGGAAGEVYRAYDPRTRRLVALKLLSDKTPQTLRRFDREVRAVVRLKRHAGVVRLFERGVTKRTPYLVMELVEGTSLDQLLAQGGLELERALKIALEVGRALAHAHRGRVLHLGLKPSNVIVKPDGQAVVVDFALAAVDDEARRPWTTLLRDPSYLPPEQALGQTDRVDQESDVYALGAILYAAICGRPPFVAESEDPRELLALIRKERPVPPSRRRPGLPTELDRLCLRALAKHPDQRLASVDELVESLEEILGVEAEPAEESESGVRTRRRPASELKRRRQSESLPLIAVVFVVGALALLGLAIWAVAG